VADEQVTILFEGSDAGAKAVIQDLQAQIEKTGASGSKAGNAIAIGLQAGINKILQLSRTIDVASKADVAALRANTAAVRELATAAGVAPAEIQKLAVAEQVLDTRLKQTTASIKQQAQALVAGGNNLNQISPKARTAANAFTSVAFAASGMTSGIQGGVIAAGTLATSLATLSSSARLAASASGIGAVLVVLGTLITLLRSAKTEAADFSDTLDIINSASSIAEAEGTLQAQEKLLDQARKKLDEFDAEMAKRPPTIAVGLDVVGAVEGFLDTREAKRKRAEIESEIAGLGATVEAAWRKVNDLRGKEGQAAGEKFVADEKRAAEEALRERQRALEEAADAERAALRQQQDLRNETIQTILRSSDRTEQAERSAAAATRKRRLDDLAESLATAATKADVRIDIENAYQAELAAIEARGLERRQRAERESLNSQRSLIFGEIATERARIEREAAEGLISQRDAEREIARIERERIPALEQIALQMTAFAEATKDPELLIAAQNLSAQIGELGIERSARAASVAVVNLKDDVIGAIGGELSQFLGSGINQVESFEDAWRSLALGVVQSIQQIIAQLIALRAMQALTGMIGGGGASVRGSPTVSLTSAGGGGGFTGPLPLIGAASGGLVRGPGTSTSDSIPAMLSNGEFVFSAAAVRRLGPDLLAALNAGLGSVQLRDFSHHRVPHFAAGGLVDAGARGAGGSFEGRISLAPGLIYEEMRRTEGARVIIETLSDHRKSIRALLGER
jgi:hypothetical protein